MKLETAQELYGFCNTRNIGKIVRDMLPLDTAVKVEDEINAADEAGNIVLVKITDSAPYWHEADAAEFEAAVKTNPWPLADALAADDSDFVVTPADEWSDEDTPVPPGTEQVIDRFGIRPIFCRSEAELGRALLDERFVR